MEETLVSPMVKQVADIVRGFNAATLSSEDGQAVAERAAANAFERLRAMPPPRRRTSRLMGFAAPPVIAVLLLTGCAGSGILCPPRYTEEVFVDGGELDPDAVVLILPGNAPGEIGYYFLHEDAETGALTLTFPLVKEVE